MRELILVAQRLQESMEISKGTRWFAKGSLMVLAIYLGSTSLIRYALAPHSVAKESAAPKKITQPPADEARFRASFEAGKQALSEGRYVSALDNFLEAERSADQLTDDQYDALKEARLQIAQVYESAGDNGAANNVYRTLADCANRKGDARFKAKSFEGALARAGCRTVLRTLDRGEAGFLASIHFTIGQRSQCVTPLWASRACPAALDRLSQDVSR